MVENSKDTARARADLRFKKQEEAATVRQKAMAEYVAESALIFDNPSKIAGVSDVPARACPARLRRC
ncbi:MAG: hypothetical protein E5V18_07490 [Mesorhizobium sp.]|nr:MAG: hypothetical protein E5V18_07490 [Mesorhizobium sp.]